MRNTLLSALRAIPVCRAAAHILAARMQKAVILGTRNYEKHILKLSHEDRCRRCKGPGETIEHISAGCPALAETEYLGRHNEFCKIIHQQLAHKYNLCQDSTPYYKYQPAPVLESPNALLYWDRPILTDKTVDYNRLDIMLIDKANAEGIIVDIAIPLRHNVRKTKEQKVSKYQNVACELQRMWKLKKQCKTYAGTAYVHRHNAALRVLYYHLRHSYGIDETPVLPYAPGYIESVVENERCRIYWNYSFPTLELVQANKPDIVLLDHQQKTMFVIEFSAPAEVNIVSKEEEKRTKYQELLGQLRRLWPDYTASLLVMVIGSLEEHGLSEQLTFSFLRSSGLKSETEGFIMACQDGVINTLVYRGRVMGMNVPDTHCRACRQAPETLMHLLSTCKTYAGTAYVHRHNVAVRVLYYHLRHSYGIDETPVLPYAPGDIESVVENERCRIYWNYSFPTLELVQANKPDIVLLDHQQKTMFVIEFSAPAEVNIVSKEEEKRTKYQELLRQLRRLWPDYTVSLLVMVIGSLDGISNTLLSALRAIPVCRAAAHILAASMQKAVILGSLRLLRAHDTRTQ
nr:unnamed protein product [Callosobruchus analis]